MNEYEQQNDPMKNGNLNPNEETVQDSPVMQAQETIGEEVFDLREAEAEASAQMEQAVCAEQEEPAEPGEQADEAPGSVENPQSEGSYHFRPASDPVYTAQPLRQSAGEAVRPAAPVETTSSKKHSPKGGSGGFGRKAVALALAFALLGGAAGFGGGLLANSMNREKQNPEKRGEEKQTSVQVAASRETTGVNVVSVESGKLMSASQVYKNNVNSTVGITTEIQTTNVWGYPVSGAAAGSGFIISGDGYILTNHHVIEKASTITVAMFDGTTYPATLVGYDASNDIAVLKIDAKDLTPVTLGDSDSIEVGDEVVAIGNPLGELTFSLTKGNVSALNRPVTLSGNVSMKLIQTDAAINSGNSGGALFNMYGEVVGITNAKFSSNAFSGEASIDNIGFAIPINSVQSIVKAIIEKGYITKPYIGVGGKDVSNELQRYGMPKGAVIANLEEGGPAQQGGLQLDDIVTAINGEAITGFEDLSRKVAAREPGDELKLTVYRKGETLELSIQVGEKTQDALPQNQQEDQNQQGGQGQVNPFGNGGMNDFPWNWIFGG